MRSEASVGTLDRGDQTRRHILDVASVLFAEKGYAGASFTDLVRASGLTKGAFYFHFPSKEALALAAFADQQERWVEVVSRVAEPSMKAVDQLAAMLKAACDFCETEVSARCVSRLCFELGEDPRLRPTLTPYLSVWEELIASIVRRGQDEGDIRADVDAGAVARVSVAAWIGVNDVARVVSDGADLRDRAEEFLQILMLGVRTVSGDKGGRSR
jgi:TetR/AcrR family transcriptional repressor of nem operon